MSAITALSELVILEAILIGLIIGFGLGIAVMSWISIDSQKPKWEPRDEHENHHH